MTDDPSRGFWRDVYQFTLWWLALSAFGVFMLYLGLTQALFLARQRDWPTVSGTVLAAEFLEDSGPNGLATPELKVVCEYLVAGKTFSSSLYTERVRDFEVIPARFRRGARVIIYYDPADPRIAVLEPSSLWGALAWAAMGSILLVVGASAVVSDIRQFFDLRMRAAALRETEHALIEMEEALEEMREIRRTTPSQRSDDEDGGTDRAP